MAKQLPDIGDYKYGFKDKDVSIFRAGRGLTKEIVEEISRMKEEPQWMLDFRLKSLDKFYEMPMPQWGGDLNDLDFDEITYYVKPSEKSESLGMKYLMKLKLHLINQVFQKLSKNIQRVYLHSTNLKLYTTT